VVRIEATDQWMGQAIRLARAASRRGEVPIGAVLVREGRLVAGGGNRTIASHDPTAHAEIVALRRAGRRAGNHRLVGSTLFVTLEPCLMCVGAMVHARISALVFGASDPKVGAISSLARKGFPAGLNHRFSWRGGVRASECATLLREFFRARREKRG
jgi:tRNA(adenine34) deaminase